jgi:protein gp37
VTPGLDWVIVGGESGTGARPVCLSWIRNIVHDCAATTDDDGSDGECRWPIGKELKLRDRKGGDPSEWSAYLRVREFPAVRP